MSVFRTPPHLAVVRKARTEQAFIKNLQDELKSHFISFVTEDKLLENIKKNIQYLKTINK